MKIKYTYVTRQTVEIEVDEKWAKIINEMDEQESNINHKESRKTTTLDTGNSESEWLLCIDENIENLFAGPSDEEILRFGISKLKPKQKELLKAIYIDGVKQEDYAKKLGINQCNVSRQLTTIKNFLKKFF